ncbi:MAG: NnrS family protein [Hyphomicrobium sp.]
MASSAAQIRAFSGPPILSYGFRPFFLFGALWAAIAVALWLPLVSGLITLPTRFQPVEWHVHELIFGYVPAVIAGFLLTAVPNWTGRLPVVGRPLLVLVGIWLAGRIAILTSLWIGGRAAAAIDLLFLAALGFVIAREIVASTNTKNLKVIAVIAVLFSGNVAFHVQVLAGVGSGHGMRTGLAAVVMLIMLIGGRIIPSFTRNWLVQHGPENLPAPFARFDVAAMIVSGAALALWTAMPSSRLTALFALAAFAINVMRLARWLGARTTGEPLVFILHAAYAFVPLGFLLLALGIVAPAAVQPAGALHAWTAGSIGVMTLAVMTRASLGHTGQALTATASIRFIYIAVVVAALARVAAAFGVAREPLLYSAAIAWVVAFGTFVVVFAPLLTRRRT